MTQGNVTDDEQKIRNSREKAPPLMGRFIIFSIMFFLIILVAGSFVFVVSMRQIIRTNKGYDLAQQIEIERIKLENSVNKEISLVLKMADSPLIKRYFASPDDPGLEKMALEEMAAYRNAFKNKSIFWVKDTDKIFHSDGHPSYRVDPENPENYWYPMSLYKTEVYNFNINYNPDINVTNLWINAPVFDDKRRPLGVMGTGINLSLFIDAIYTNYKGRGELYFFNAAGEITGAKDVAPVARKENIEKKLGLAGFDILATAKQLGPGETHALDTVLGKTVLGSVPSLGWYSVMFMPDGMDDYNNALTIFFLVVIVVIAAIFVIFNMFIAGILTPLRKTMLDLEATSKYKSDFLAMMSHEIRTPMNAIIGIAQVQLQKNDLEKESAGELEKIYDSAKNLLGIINDILDMSKIETGKLGINPAEYDVPRLIGDAVQLNVIRIEAKPVDFVLDIHEDMPSKLYGDELRLKQILNNLLSNAIKYTEKGTVQLTVRHAAQSGDGEDVTLCFVVKDTGQGIRPEDQKRLFSEYMRFNTGANRATEGTGLGLNITQKLVGLMGGTIGVESEYGKGSAFTVTVKQKAVACGAIGPELAAQLRACIFLGCRQAENQHIVYEPMPYGKVLVVDDLEINLYVAEELLSLYSLSIETASSGYEAMEKVESGKNYDLIFMDHMMPQMDGVETTQKLRALGYKGVIVALTANALAGNEKMFAQNGFDGFIPKPIDIKYLDEVLARFIRDRHPEEAGKWNRESG